MKKINSNFEINRIQPEKQEIVWSHKPFKNPKMKRRKKSRLSIPNKDKTESYDYNRHTISLVEP